MNKITSAMAVAFSLLITAGSAIATDTQKCGNDCPGGPTKCGGCNEKGANPFGPYSGSVHREITDLEMFGGVGEEKLSFSRLTTSRYKPGIPTPFGSGGSWRHNYFWNVVPGGVHPVTGTEMIHVDYPDGTEHDFHKETTSSLYLTGVSSTQERIEQLSTDPNQYYLWFPDGKRVSFYKITGSGDPIFRVQGFYDRYSNFYEFTVDDKNRIIRVTEPGGRSIQMTYGSIGKFPVKNVTFTYENPTATSVWLAGDFNDWHGDDNHMTNDHGVWTTTIPLQIGATYQYKFVVNTNVFVRDPNNPITIGDNSAIENFDLNTSSDSPVPITFSWSQGNPTSVSVAGSFNGWNASALTRNGNTWSTTIYITPGHWLYKFMIDGTTWVVDPMNQLTRPDGYGGYNSVLNIGPLDEAITQVQTSDGRYVTYTYNASLVGFAVYSTLTAVNYGYYNAHPNFYPDRAHYTYMSPTTNFGRPVLATADDTHYKGPMRGVRYTYQDNGIEGFVASEASLVDGTVVASVAPSTTGDRSVTTGGRSLQLTFAQGNLSTEIDSLQRTKTYEYFDGGYGMLYKSTEWNRPTPSASPIPYVTQFDRTSQFGNVWKETLPDTKTRITNYPNTNKPFFPDWTEDENSHRTTFTRDSDNRPKRIDYADGSYETFDYDPDNFNLMTSHCLRNGYCESFEYYTKDDADGGPGDIKKKTSAAGEITIYTYDAAGRMLTMKDGRDNVTAYDYSERGQITRITYADASFTSFEYDVYGNKTKVTNEIGKPTNYGFDQYNRLTDVTDPLNRNTHYEYGDPQAGGGGCGCNFENHPTSIMLPSGKLTMIGYDSEWRKTSVTVGATSPDAATTRYEYDDVGDVTKMIDPRQKEWPYEFDKRKRKTRATDPNGNYTQWTYDGVGNKKTEKRSGDPIETRYDYDGGNHLTDITDQAGHNTHMMPDGAGNVLSLRDAKLNTYTFTYDGMNRKTSLAYPSGGGTETWVYDEAGNLQKYRTRSGQDESFVYDKRNRETEASWSDTTPGTVKKYDAAGRLLSTASSVSVLSYAYDDANRLQSETQRIVAYGSSRIVSYGYDADGNRTSIGYPSGSAVSLDYTKRNQLKGVAAGIITAGYAYDLNGNPQTIALGDGTVGTLTHDNANRFMAIDHQKNGISFARYDYTYDPVNTRKARTETIAGASQIDGYLYDEIDELKQVTYNVTAAATSSMAAPGGGIIPPSTIPGGILGTFPSPNRVVAYNYDSVGNRNGPNGVSETIAGSTTNTNYTPNNLNEYTAVGSISPTYNANGDMNGQNGWSYGYDALNRMTSASNSTTSITFSYDGRNRCVSRTINGSVTFLYYDDWKLIEEQNASGALVARYIHGARTDELISMATTASTSYYHYDALGSTVALTNSSGNLVEHYTYDVFGAPTIINNSSNMTVPVSAVGNRFLFTGREYIQQAALYDYRNRIYTPQFGRFLQTDPMRFKARDVNLYRYVGNRVTSLTDPHGLIVPYSPVDFGGIEDPNGNPRFGYTYYTCTASIKLKNCPCKNEAKGTATRLGDSDAARDGARDGAVEDLKSNIPQGCEADGDSPNMHCEDKDSKYPIA